jgi:threonine synthase
MTIKYRSTRGGQSGLSFEQVVLGGLAEDKGLYIPEEIPTMSAGEIEKLRGMTYSELAYEVVSKFVSPDEIPTDALKSILTRSFSKFRSPEVTPSKKLAQFWVLELFHGPTFAFKDVALQFLGNTFEYFLLRGKNQKSITILGATSGDTGSAAIHGLRGKANVNCFILYPTGKVTEIQEKQMTTIPDENVHCLSVDGDFDDCQAIVKRAFADKPFRDEVKLGAINSINWARILAQITYYFYSWLRITDKEGKNKQVNFVVPTGNFGDILAGYYAKKMGLKVGKLVIATNQNDVLHRFMQSGEYKKTGASVLTIAPSMDISISSNFERYLFYLCGEDTRQLALWMGGFERTGSLSVSKAQLKKAQEDFASHPSSEAAIVSGMQGLWKREQYLVCPHSATAVNAISALRLPASTTAMLATAHPAKFEAAMDLALKPLDQAIPARPPPLEEMFGMPVRFTLAKNSLAEVQGFVRAKLLLASSSENGDSCCPCALGTSTKATVGLALACGLLSVGLSQLALAMN